METKTRIIEAIDRIKDNINLLEAFPGIYEAAYLLEFELEDLADDPAVVALREATYACEDDTVLEFVQALAKILEEVVAR